MWWNEAISLCMLVVLVSAEIGRIATPLPELERGRPRNASLPELVPLPPDEVKLATDLRPRLVGRLPGREENAPDKVELGL